MNVEQAIILGALQGVTEWLPISSSGHLVLLQKVMLSQNSVLFDIMVHGGTLLAVLLFFWRDVLTVLKNFFGTFPDLLRRGPGAFTSSYERRLSWYLVLATVPIVVVGLLLQDYVNEIFNDARLVGICFLITGVWLLLTRFSGGRKKVNLRSSLLIGLAQAAAILPGISRSGSTIATGMLSGVDKEEAAKFSFLLSIPAIAGALTLEILRYGLSSAATTPNLVGFLTSFIVGVLSIKFLLEVIRRGRFHLFSIYCFGIGLLALTVLS